MPAIHQANMSSLPQPTASSFSHFRFSNPKIGAPGIPVKGSQYSPSLSETAEPSQRSGAWKTCSSLKQVSFISKAGLAQPLRPSPAPLFPSRAEDSPAGLPSPSKDFQQNLFWFQKEHKCLREEETQLSALLSTTLHLCFLGDLGSVGIRYHNPGCSALLRGYAFSKELCVYVQVCQTAPSEHCTTPREANSNDFQ